MTLRSARCNDEDTVKSFHNSTLTQNLGTFGRSAEDRLYAMCRNVNDINVSFIVSPCIFVHLVFHQLMHSYIIKILSQAVTLIAHFTPTCFDPCGSSSGSTTGPC